MGENVVAFCLESTCFFFLLLLLLLKKKKKKREKKRKENELESVIDGKSTLGIMCQTLALISGSSCFGVLLLLALPFLPFRLGLSASWSFELLGLLMESCNMAILSTIRFTTTSSGMGSPLSSAALATAPI